MIRFVRTTTFLAVCLFAAPKPALWAASAESRRGTQAGGAETGLAAGEVGKLIEQLGSDQYFVRRQAEQALIARGADAFDQLQEAEKHDDLEIASSAHYILQQIRIEWTRPDDSAAVQKLMQRYGELSKSERFEKMDKLADLAEDDGLGALCRIARFDSSPQLARYAALKVLQAKRPTEPAGRAPAVIAAEVGESPRAPSEWLRTYAEFLVNPEQTLERWLAIIDKEAALIEADSPDTELAFVFELIDAHLEFSRDKRQPAAVFAGLRRRTELYVANSGRLRDGVLYAMNWLWENEQWDALSLLEDHYGSTIRDDRLLLYFSAASRWKEGRAALGEEIAERAYMLESEDNDERFQIADLIGEMGRHDWAEREWWKVVEVFPVLDGNSLSARSRLATLRLHDRGEDRRAAALMDEVCQAVAADEQKLADAMGHGDWRQRFNQFHAQREYFLACQAVGDGDYEAQRKHLDAAYGYDSAPIKDVDVLIAMYRSHGADENYRHTAIERIRHTAAAIGLEIEQDPENSQHYNHWAWLISNTEGDYEQAVKYSLRSLELSPDSPSYLDTLGRCYYAAGDLEKAVKFQREAVRRHPHLQVMRDQLQLFESALAERGQQ